MRFEDSGQCQSGATCGLCRDRTAGAALRAGVASAFEPMDGGAEFTCPRGLPWHEGTPPRSWMDKFKATFGSLAKAAADVALGRYASAVDKAARLAKCAACPHRTESKAGPACGKLLRDAANPAAPGCGCLLDAKASLASSACPIGAWGPVNPA